MSVIIKFKKFQNLRSSEKLALIEAWLLIALSILAIRLIPFRLLSRCLGTHMAISPGVSQDLCEKEINIVKQSVYRANNNFPLKVVCMPMAMTAKMMLARRGIDSTLYMGVRRNESGELSAHAWLRAGETVLTGNLEREKYIEVSSFA